MGLRRFYGGLTGGPPSWAALVIGAAAVALGASITLKPFSSVGVLVALIAAGFMITGLGELASAQESLDRLVGGLWIGGGIVVAGLPGATIRVIAVAVGVVLVVGGILKVISAFRGHMNADERLIAGISGLARAIFGVLALSAVRSPLRLRPTERALCGGCGRPLTPTWSARFTGNANAA